MTTTKSTILQLVAELGEQDTFVSELAKIVMPQDFGRNVISVEVLNVWSVFELLNATDEQYIQAYDITKHWFDKLNEE